jgi:hypothetical protein
MLDTEPGKPVAVLDHNPAHPGIGQDRPQPGADAVHARPDHGHRRIQRDPAFTGFPSDPSGPSFHLITLVSGRNTTVSNTPPLGSAEGSTTIVPVGSWRADTAKVPAWNFRAVSRHPSLL